MPNSEVQNRALFVPDSQLDSRHFYFSHYPENRPPEERKSSYWQFKKLLYQAINANRQLTSSWCSFEIIRFNEFPFQLTSNTKLQDKTKQNSTVFKPYHFLKKVSLSAPEPRWETWPTNSDSENLDRQRSGDWEEYEEAMKVKLEVAIAMEENGSESVGSPISNFVRLWYC